MFYKEQNIDPNCLLHWCKPKKQEDTQERVIPLSHHLVNVLADLPQKVVRRVFNRQFEMNTTWMYVHARRLFASCMALAQSGYKYLVADLGENPYGVKELPFGWI